MSERTIGVVSANVRLIQQKAPWESQCSWVLVVKGEPFPAVCHRCGDGEKCHYKPTDVRHD